MLKKIKKELDERMKVREEALKMQRNVVPLCAQAIRSLLAGKKKQAKNKLKEAEKIIKKAEKLLKKHPDLVKTVLGNAYQEYAEAMILASYLEMKKLPEVKVPAEYYLTGLGDAIGELKRFGMQLLARGKVEEAGELLKSMEDLYYEFSQFVYPGSIAPGLKKKQDVARAVLNSFQDAYTNAVIKKGTN